MLNVSHYKHPDEFPIDVQQLFAIGEQESIESSVYWYRNLINTVYPKDDGINTYVLRKNGKPVAALPVRSIKTPFGQKVEALSNYYTALYSPLLTNELAVSDMTILISAVKNAHVSTGIMTFSPMDPSAGSYRTLFLALQANGLVAFKFFRFGNWYLQVQNDWSTYLKNREGTIRSTIKRMHKKFLTDGGVLELIQDATQLERGIDAYQRVYASSWKKPEPYPEFIPGLIRICVNRGWLRLGIAWLNGQPIAAQLWIVANGKANIYKLAYDEKYKSYASGTLLTAMLMEHAFEQDKVFEVDYLIGDDAYKKSWMSDRRERWGIIAYNPKAVAGMFGLCKEAIWRTLKPLLARLRTASAASKVRT
ncbi:Acetyltransferase (GNAT) domain-containing protein [Polaromonas sp. OV174]|nr:Acetyltransferase (GNAT) domain-containing protein [Polaromonas sp. OV174]